MENLSRLNNKMTKEIKCPKCGHNLKAATVYEFDGETKETFIGILWGYQCKNCGSLIKKERVK